VVEAGLVPGHLVIVGVVDAGHMAGHLLIVGVVDVGLAPMVTVS
jgi:hypothetical protein